MEMNFEAITSYVKEVKMWRCHIGQHIYVITKHESSANYVAKVTAKHNFADTVGLSCASLAEAEVMCRNYERQIRLQGPIQTYTHQRSASR